MFNDKVMAVVQNQIVSAVTRVSKEHHNQLLGLIEDAISGMGRGGRTETRRKVLFFILGRGCGGGGEVRAVLLVILSVVVVVMVDIPLDSLDLSCRALLRIVLCSATSPTTLCVNA